MALRPSCTLREFYVAAMLPLVHADANPRTLKEYLTTINVWERETSNPPLNEIDALVLAEFRNRYAAQNTRATANKHIRHINHILAKAGPPGPRNRDALGILRTAPWAKEMQTYHRRPRTVSFDAIDMAYSEAGLYFRAFIVAAYNLGSRWTALVNLKSDDVDWEAGMAYFRAEHDKLRTDRVKPLNSTVIRHFARLKKHNLLYWRLSTTSWRKRWRLILDEAGLEGEDYFTPHDLKRTCGTQLGTAGANPWQRRYMLDHAQADVTGESYIDPLHDLAEVVARMPQPGSFQPAKECRHDRETDPTA